MRLVHFFEATNPDVRVKQMRDGSYRAYLNRKHVGSASVYGFRDSKVGPNERYIWKSVVDPEYQRRGVATAIYDAIAADLESQGLKLVPSPDQQLSDDAYQFWKARDPESIKNHSHFKSEPYKHLIGTEREHKGRPVEVMNVGWAKGADAPMLHVRYTDMPDGAANSRTSIVVKESAGISPEEAAELIARDDELFDAVASYTAWPDVFDEEPEQLAKLLNILRQISPFRKRLYRGEMTFEYNDYQPPSDKYTEYGFTSWSASEQVVKKWFHEPGKMVKYTDGPIQAISIADVAEARMRSHPGESHYGGMQSEYLVLEPVKRLVETVGSGWGSKYSKALGSSLMETFARSDVENISWFWAHPQSGRIYHFDGSHTTAATDPSGPIGLTVDDFGGNENIDMDDFRVFRAAFQKGWVRSFFIPDDGSNPLGAQIGLHGADREIVELTLKMLLDGGLDADYAGLRGEFDGYEYDEPLD